MTASSSVDVVRAFFDAIYRLDFDAAVEFFTDDGSYHDMPIPTDPSVGKVAIRRKLDFMVAGGVERMTYEIRHLVGDGDVVLCERSETWHFPSGARPTLRVMCTIELREGKIAAWREYWNQSELMDAMPPEFFAGVGSIGRRRKRRLLRRGTGGRGLRSIAAGQGTDPACRTWS